jgi:hypothetical protein
LQNSINGDGTAAFHSDTWSDITDDIENSSTSIILPRIKGLKVLLLGQNSRRVEVAARELQKNEVNVIAAQADENGYRIALKFAPDVVISEMARPGDPEWWLFKRFHRHPALKWTPALLMKWWSVEDGTEKFLINRIFERLSEALTPIRILEERIAAGRKLNDRVELTGMQTIIKVLANAGLTGSLSVNDSWNVFSVEFKKGKIVAVNRDGMDGEESSGLSAFFQLMLCDSGHWTFKISDSVNRLDNINLSLSELLDEVFFKMSMLIGPDALKDEDFINGIKVYRSFVHDIAATFTGIERDVSEAVAAGVSKSELAAIIDKTADKAAVERAVIILMRSGAISIYPSEETEAEDKNILKPPASVIYLFKWLNEDHHMRVDTDFRRKESSELVKDSVTGFYDFSKAQDETSPIPGSALGTAGKDGGREEVLTETITDVLQPSGADFLLSGPLSKPVFSEADSAWRRQYETVNRSKGGFFLTSRSEIALNPDLTADKRGKRQMWLALTIALFLGVLLVLGLIAIGSDAYDKVNTDKVNADKNSE